MSIPPEQPPAFSFHSAPTPQHARQLLGERLRAARLAAHLTQQGLAGHTHSKAYISAVECGRMMPSLKALQLLAERQERPLSYFFGEENEPPLIAPEAPVAEEEHAARLDEAERLVQEGRYEEAIARCEQIGQRDRTIWAYEQYALFLAAEGRFREAYEQMRRAIQRSR